MHFSSCVSELAILIAWLMQPTKISDVIAAAGGELVSGDKEGQATGVSTDTRTIRAGDLFFALIGENADGHDYVGAAMEKGAAAAVVSRPVEAEGTVISVPDTLAALGDLAAWYRRQFNVRAVAVTGSVGKTTTKEMIAAVLARRFRVLKNEGNYNNEIGVPLTVLQLGPEHQILVQELAMRLPGEIAELAEIVRPDIGVITNVGLSHIERLGTQDRIAAAKAELLEALQPEGLAVLNADDPYFGYLAGKSRGDVIAFAATAGDIRGEDVKVDGDGRPSFTVAVGQTRFAVKLPLVGEHNVPNALAAVAVGLSFGVPTGEIVRALEEFSPPEKRANVLNSLGGWRIFDDTYNASPASMMSALRTLAAMSGRRRIAVLGDMRELGDVADRAHLEVGRVAAESGLSVLVTVGELGRRIADGAREAGFARSIEEYRTSEEAAVALKEEVRPGDVVLVKGSRAMKMENVVEALG